MARRVLTILSSDLSGEEIEDGKGGTVNFALEGTDYEIDLTDKEADELRKALKKYTDVARRSASRSTRTSSRRSGSSSGRSGSGRSPEELQAIRDWANSNGYNVSSRGRVKKEILDAYDKVN